ncbi:peptidoglycan-binding protein [Moorena producens JHB]|uniref:Peptidoglycan-binding protein n=1 Tax=Moorena producens (strain JHB) TaxID=1454205 RepID=A0A1D9FZG5_MOOP1|nr:peptidoglycan-binding protein [Moorena producens]AOY80654.1 peptidoglycan-binding protein [Moorena producens JHB]
MESLVCVNLAESYEDADNFQWQDDNGLIRWLDGLNTPTIPSSAWIKISAIAIALTILSTAANASAKVLQKGSRGAQVTSLQKELAAAGFYKGRITGNYDMLTQSYVAIFQQNKGLPIDGVAGPKTLAALYKTAGTDIRLPTNTQLKRGSRGTVVSDLQKKLTTLGFFNGPITGYYGRMTQAAVIKFQRAKGLPVDGVAGPNTLFVINGGSIKNATELRRGNKGTAVTKLQQRMRELKVYNGPVTGFYGRLTEAGVVKFQRLRGLPVTGIADSRTLSDLAKNPNDKDNITNVTELRPGSNGESVTKLQNRLAQLGFYKGPVTGYYGKLTETAVKEYQLSRELPANGIADSRTLSALRGNSSGIAVAASIITPLKRGSSGTRVNSLQNRLIYLGYYKGLKDGVFGPATEAALKRYQRDKGLFPNGIADAKTFSSLSPR